METFLIRVLPALFLSGTWVGAAELATWKGHEKEVRCAVFSPDGKMALSGSLDRTLKLWDASSGQELGTWTGHSDAVLSVAFSPDGAKALSASKDKTLKLWDVASGQTIATWEGHLDAVNAAAFSPDGQSAVSAGKDGTRKLWDVASGKTIPIWREKFKGSVDNAAFSPSGNIVLFGNSNSTAKICTTGQNNTCWVYTINLNSANAFSPDARAVLSGSLDGSLTRWEATTEGDRLTWKGTWKGHDVKVNSVAYAPDGKTVLSASSDGTVKLWDAASGRNIAVWTGHKGPVLSVAYSPDGKTALSASSDRTLKLWDVVGELARVEYFNYGKQSVKEGKLDQALNYLEKSVAAQPDNNAYRNWLGSVYYDLGQNEKALKHLQETASLRSSDAWNYYIALSLFKLERLGEAKEALGKALQDGPEKNRESEHAPEINALIQRITDYQKRWGLAQAKISEENLDEAMTELLAAAAVINTNEAKEKTEEISRKIIKRDKRARMVQYGVLTGLALTGLAAFLFIRTKKRRAARSQLAARLHALISQAGSRTDDLAASLPQTPISPDEIKEIYRQYLKLGGDAKQFSDAELSFINQLEKS